MESTLKLASNATYGQMFDADLASAYLKAEVSTTHLLATVEKIRYHLSGVANTRIEDSELSEFIQRYEIPVGVKAALKVVPLESSQWDDVGLALRLANTLDRYS